MVEIMNLDEVERVEIAGHSSKGNQLKWKTDGFWYKADHMGYEGLSEVLISRLLAKSNAAEFVRYEPVQIQYGGVLYNGCKSINFLKPGEELITVDHLFRQYTGRSLTKEMAQMPEVGERISYLVENVKAFTGLQQFGEYLTITLGIDAFFLNEDRHTNNIAVIYCDDTKTYRLCPCFDHGLSLFSDITTDFTIDQTAENCLKKISAKPFSRDFDEQLGEAEKLYKEQVRFTFGKKDIAREIKSLEDIYEKRIMGRVEDILYMQFRKYQYLL